MTGIKVTPISSSGVNPGWSKPIVFKCGLQTPKGLQDPFRGSERSKLFDDDTKNLSYLYFINLLTFDNSKDVEDKTSGSLAEM